MAPLSRTTIGFEDRARHQSRKHFRGRIYTRSGGRQWREAQGSNARDDVGACGVRAGDGGLRRRERRRGGKRGRGGVAGAGAGAGAGSRAGAGGRAGGGPGRAARAGGHRVLRVRAAVGDALLLPGDPAARAGVDGGAERGDAQARRGAHGEHRAARARGDAGPGRAVPRQRGGRRPGRHLRPGGAVARGGARGAGKRSAILAGRFEVELRAWLAGDGIRTDAVLPSRGGAKEEEPALRRAPRAQRAVPVVLDEGAVARSSRVRASSTTTPRRRPRPVL